MNLKLGTPILAILTVLACAAHEPPASATPASSHGSAAAPSGTKGLVRTSTLPSGVVQQEELPVRLVAVGISDFQNLGEQDDLKRGAEDAQWFVDQLKTSVKLTESVVLTGQNATTKKVEEEVLRVLAGATSKDVVMLYFSTHGATVRNSGYLMAWDTQPEGKLPYTSFSTAKLKDAITKSRAEQVVVLADAVHQTLKGPSGLSSGPDSNVDANIAALADAAKKKSGGEVLVLTGKEVKKAADSQDPCGGVSVFTCAVASALMGKADYNHDGLASLEEITHAVPSVTIASAQGGDKSRDRPTASGSASSGLSVAVVPASLESAPKISTADWSAVVEEQKDIRICYLKNDRIVPVTDVFHTGDQFAARITVPDSGRLSVVNVGPDKAVNVLLPLPGEDNKVSGGTTVQIMPGDHPDPIVLVDPTGQEKLYFFWSPASEGAPKPEELVAAAQKRANANAVASADAPSQDWPAGTKGLSRLSQVPSAQSGETCNTYKPQQMDRGWVVELTLEHK